MYKRQAQVFFIKTIYSVLVSFFCLFMNQPFPFIPIQITLIDACVEAYPSFLTIFESDTRQIRGRFLPTALSHAAPFGITAAVMIGFMSIMAVLTQPEKVTVMYFLLILISMAAVVKSCIPFSPLRIFICVTMAMGISGALLILPSLFEVTPVSGNMLTYLAIVGIMSLLFVVMLEAFRSLTGIGESLGTGTKHGKKGASV